MKNAVATTKMYGFIVNYWKIVDDGTQSIYKMQC